MVKMYSVTVIYMQFRSILRAHSKNKKTPSLQAHKILYYIFIVFRVEKKISFLNIQLMFLQTSFQRRTAVAATFLYHQLPDQHRLL